MGKPRPKKRRGAAAVNVKPTAAAAKSRDYSIDDVLQKAEDCMDEYKYDLARKFCERALEMDSDNVKALELTAGLLLELGQIDSAQQCLGRAIFLQPNEGHSKYLTLAQILSGSESRDLYRKGAEVIASRLSSLPPTDEKVPELRRDLSNAYVSIAEIYMTDLCDNEEAEQEAKECISKSVESDGTNPESFQALANFSLVTGDTDSARTAIDKSTSFWLDEQVKFLENGEGTETTLSYTFRLSTAKILLDLEDFDTANKVLDSLVAEDEQVVTAWYLLGWLNFLRTKCEPEYAGNARYYLNRAKEVNQVAPTDDDPMVEHINELLTELGEENEESTSANDGGEKVNIAVAEPDAVAELLDQDGDNDDAGGGDEKMES